jgi:hypothetical protein
VAVKKKGAARRKLESELPLAMILENILVWDFYKLLHAEEYRGKSIPRTGSFSAHPDQAGPIPANIFGTAFNTLRGEGLDGYIRLLNLNEESSFFAPFDEIVARGIELSLADVRFWDDSEFFVGTDDISASEQVDNLYQAMALRLAGAFTDFAKEKKENPLSKLNDAFISYDRLRNKARNPKNLINSFDKFTNYAFEYTLEHGDLFTGGKIGKFEGYITTNGIARAWLKNKVDTNLIKIINNAAKTDSKGFGLIVRLTGNEANVDDYLESIPLQKLSSYLNLAQSEKAKKTLDERFGAYTASMLIDALDEINMDAAEELFIQLKKTGKEELGPHKALFGKYLTSATESDYTVVMDFISKHLEYEKIAHLRTFGDMWLELETIIAVDRKEAAKAYNLVAYMCTYEGSGFDELEYVVTRILPAMDDHELIYFVLNEAYKYDALLGHVSLQCLNYGIGDTDFLLKHAIANGQEAEGYSIITYRAILEERFDDAMNTFNYLSGIDGFETENLDGLAEALGNKLAEVIYHLITEDDDTRFSQLSRNIVRLTSYMPNISPYYSNDGLARDVANFYESNFPRFRFNGYLNDFEAACNNLGIDAQPYIQRIDESQI